MAEERMVPSSMEYVELLFHWHRYHIAASIAEGKIVTDLGCGEGYGAYHIAGSAANVIAVDINEEIIQKAKAKYVRGNLNFLPGSATQVPFADSFVDLVVSFEMIEHLDEGDQNLFLQEVKRVLKPNGVFLVSTPDKLRTDHFPQKNPYHKRELYLKEFVELLKRYFKHVKLYFQEINLSSLVWSENKQGGEIFLRDFRVTCDKSGSNPTERDMDIYMYVIAECWNDRECLGTSLSSVCYDIKRRPLEDLWDQNGAFAFECEQLKKRTGLLQAQNDALQRDNKYYARQLENLSTQNESIMQQNKHLTRSIQQLQSKYSRTEFELQAIHDSQTWKMVKKYRFIMDQSFLGSLLKPLRALLFFIFKIRR